MSKITDKLIKFLLLTIGFFSSKISLSSRLKFGIALGTMLRIFSKKRQRITYDNIRHAFPEYNDEQCRHLVKASYANLGKVLVEIPCMKYFNEEDYRKYVKFENSEIIHNNRDKGMILMSGHFGNWEFTSYAVGLYHDIPVSMIVKHQKNKYVDAIINEYRTKGGNQVVFMDNAARAIVKTIRSGGVVAIIADQSARRNNGIATEFFGREVLTYAAPAELALKFNVPIICGFAHRDSEGVYHVKMSELKSDDLENNDEGILELTKRHVKALENAIREQPEMWSWQHRRWKYNPGKTTDLYKESGLK